MDKNLILNILLFVGLSISGLFIGDWIVDKIKVEYNNAETVSATIAVGIMLIGMYFLHF